MNTFQLATFLALSGSTALGLFVYFGSPGRRSNQGFAVLSAAMALWLACVLASIGVLGALAGFRGGEVGLGVAIGLMAVLGLGVGPELSGRVSVEGIAVGAPVGGSTDVALTRWTRPGEPCRFPRWRKPEHF